MLLLLCRIPTPDGLDLAAFSGRQASCGGIINTLSCSGWERGRMECSTCLWLGSDSSNVSLF